MKKIPVFIFIFTLLIFSCSDKIPEDILSKDEMTNILIEMHLAEAKVGSLGLNTDSSALLYEAMEKRVLEEQNLSEAAYLKSYNYYLENIKLMEDVYARVVDSLSLRESIVTSR